MHFADLSSHSIVMNESSNGAPTLEINAITMSSCQIGPQFPTWLPILTTLTGFRFLNLSQSHLFGKILEKARNMILLESLDL
ncbi:hypothetical protein CFP56_031441 [Quercus suber]|uniref:Uncharacterized protein n=1 Tax=Quercus suber TaxID=58331 RepID=A0AAW0LU91_QUESU